MNFEEAKVQITFSYRIYPHHVLHKSQSKSQQFVCCNCQRIAYSQVNMKLDTRALRYLSNDDWRVLAAVCTRKKYLGGSQAFSTDTS